MKHFTITRFAKTSLPLAVWLETPQKNNFHEWPHTHDCHEIMLLQEGTGWCGINGKHYPMLKGNLFHIVKGDTHEFSTRKGIRFYNLMFTEDFLTQEEALFFNTFLKTSGNFALPPLAVDTISDLLMELSGELSRKAAGVTLVAHALFTQALTHVCRSSNRISDEMRNSHEAQTAQLLELLSQAFKKRLSLDAIARIMNMSPGYAGRLVQKLTGVSFTEYIRNNRLGMARQLLENTETPITEIAFNLGYFDSPHFDKEFRKALGCSPLEYRRSAIKA